MKAYVDGLPANGKVVITERKVMKSRKWWQFWRKREYEVSRSPQWEFDTPPKKGASIAFMYIVNDNGEFVE